MASANDGKIGLPMTTALVIGTIIGAAIFMLPVTLSPLGQNSLIGWLLSGIGVCCIAFAFAQISRSGGDGIQANIEREFGPTTGFLVAWAFWVSNWTAEASVAIAVGSTLSFIMPSGGQTLVLPVAVACVIILTVINAMGVRAAGGFSMITVAIKVLPLLAVIWLCLDRGVSGGSYEPLAPSPVNAANLATATALTFYALTGFEAATAPVCKIRNAERTLPRALMLGTGFVVLLYLAAGTSIQLLLPADVVASSSAPFADALTSRWGQAAATLAAIAIAISAIGCLNNLILGTGELGYSMALRGDLPSAMAKTHGKGTPVISQVVGSVVTILLLLANSSRATVSLYTFVILLSAASIIVLYFAAAVAAWKANRAIGSRTLVSIALLFVAFAIYGTGVEANLWCLVLLAAGLAIRAVMRRLNSRAGSTRPAAAIPAAPPGSSA
jgi:APA family basic amino acid/polyamine antiporter